MKVINPNAPAKVTVADKTDLQNALAACLEKGNGAPTFEQIRAELGAKAARFDDGMIHQTALDLSMKVEP